MWTKPHYRQKRVRDVHFGDKVYSSMLGETFCVTDIKHIGPKIELIEGCFTLRANRNSRVWVETKPRCLK